MKNRILTIAFLIVTQATAALAQAGFEQYYYVQNKQPMTMVPIVHVQNSKNWYAEARYNYEAERSFSLYVGKSFSKDSERLSYAVTPIAGGVGGEFKGASVGFNAMLEYGKLFFSSQSQYTSSFKDHAQDFLFSWTELGYQPLSWFYLGCTVQHTQYTQSKNYQVEPGVVVGFTLGRWTFPLYGFNPLSTNPYLVLGINHAIGLTKKNAQKL